MRAVYISVSGFGYDMSERRFFFIWKRYGGGRGSFALQGV